MPRRSGWRVALAASTVSLIAAAPLIAVEPALAQPYPPGPSIELDDVTLAPGDEVDFVATGFQPHEEVEASLVPDGDGAAGAAGAAASTTGSVNNAVLRGSASFPALLSAPSTGDGDDGHDDGGDDGGRETVELGTFFADANGRVSGTVTIPEDTKPGEYDFTLEGLESGLVLTAQVTIEGDDHDDDHGDDHGRGDDDHGDDHGRGDDDHGDDHGRGDDHGDDDHGRPGHGGGDHDDDHGRSGHGGGDHDDSYDDRGDHDDSDSGGKSSDDHGSSLAKTGSSDATVAMAAAASGLVLLGGGSLVLVKRRRSAAHQK